MFKLLLAFIAGMIVMDLLYAYRTGHLQLFLHQTKKRFLHR